PFRTKVGQFVAANGPARPDTWESGPMAFALAPDVTPPVVRDGAMPKAVREAGNEGVILDFTVDANGAVKDVRPRHGSKFASDELGSYVANWKFRPATKDGQPVEVAGAVSFTKGQGDAASNVPVSPPRPKTSGVTLTRLDPVTVDDVLVSNAGR